MVFTIFGWLLSASIVAPAFGDDFGPFNKRCYENYGASETIQACSAVIARGLVSKEDLATAFRNRANAYDDQGEFDRAIDDYDHAIAINPEDADSYNDRGTAYREKGQYGRAIEDYDRAISRSPDNAMALSNRCFAKAVVGQLEQALVDCNVSFRLRPHNADTLAARGFTYLKLKHFDAAITDYDAELRINPGNPYTLFGRGIAKRMKGNLSGGDADIIAAKTIRSDIADEMAKLGVQHESGAGSDPQTAGRRGDP
jgi:tetratricopeptide (TPR) repeat protein